MKKKTTNPPQKILNKAQILQHNEMKKKIIWSRFGGKIAFFSAGFDFSGIPAPPKKCQIKE